jgi:hypothetical protein
MKGGIDGKMHRRGRGGAIGIEGWNTKIVGEVYVAAMTHWCQ